MSLSGTNPSRFTPGRILPPLILLLAYLFTRLWYLQTPDGRHGDADEAVFGLMSWSIYTGANFPIFCWGAHYAGAVMCYLAAALFPFVSPGYILFHAIMLTIGALAILPIHTAMSRCLPPRQAAIGVLAVILGPYVYLHYGVAFLGGYGESWLALSLLMWLSFNSLDSPPSPLRVALIGLVSGFSSYILFLVLPAVAAFALPSVLMHRGTRVRNAVIFLSSATLGFLPAILYNIHTHGSTVLRAAGRSISINTDPAILSRTSLLAEMIAAKFTATVDWFISLPRVLGTFVIQESAPCWLLNVAGVILIALLFLFVLRAARRDTPMPIRLLGLFVVMLVGFAWLAGLNRPRHWMLLLPVLPVALFTLTPPRINWAAYVAILLVTFGQVVGWPRAANQPLPDPALTAQALTNMGVSTFYGSYWTVYPIMFETKFVISGAPILLPHGGPLSDRTPEISRQVAASPSPAFLFSSQEGELRQRFEDFIAREKISAEKADIHGSVLYHRLNPTVDACVTQRWVTSFTVRCP